jgi:hypothetical protein
MERFCLCLFPFLFLKVSSKLLLIAIARRSAGLPEEPCSSLFQPVDGPPH